MWEDDLCRSVGIELSSSQRFWPHCTDSHVAAWLPSARQRGGALTQPGSRSSAVEQRRSARPGRSAGTQDLCCQAPRCSCRWRSPWRFSSFKEAKPGDAAVVQQRQSALPAVCGDEQRTEHFRRGSRHRPRHAPRSVVFPGRGFVHGATCALRDSFGCAVCRLVAQTISRRPRRR